MPRRNLIWIAAIIAAAVVTMWVTRGNPPQPGRAESEEFAPVGDTYELIQDRYYRPVQGRRLRRGAVNGMVSVLDEWSSYVPADRVKAFESRMMGMRRGIGLRLERADGEIRVIGPLVNSPAHKGGIVGGDVILAVNGEAVVASQLPAVEEALRCDLGETVELTIRRTDAERRMFSLRCEEFRLETVQGLYRDVGGRWVFLIDPAAGLAYVRIREFVHDTGGRLREILRDIGGARGLVLDLRDNPGGTLPAIEEVCDLFLSEGVIGTSVGRNRRPQRYVARPPGTIPEIPMVVLINAGTASAAEIIAGALRLHDRTVLVGTRTRGKGCVQSMFPLPDQLGQVNLTTSELLVGESRPITRRPGSDVWGVDPHPGQEVLVPPERMELLRRAWVRAEVLPRPERGSPRTMPTTAATRPANTRYRAMLKLDPQLRRALELLARPEAMAEILRREAERRAAETDLTTRRAEASE